MPTFVYTAQDRAGNTTNGTIDSDSDVSALALLRTRGLWVKEIRPAGAPGAARPDVTQSVPAMPSAPPRSMGIGSGYAAPVAAPQPQAPPAGAPYSSGTPLSGIGAGPRPEVARPAAVSAPAPLRTDDSFGKRLHSPVSLKDLSLLYRQLHTMLNSGVGIYSALEMLSDPRQCPNAALRKVVADIARQALNGRTVSEAMARYPWLFPKMHVRMVEAGEAGGFLVDVLRRLAEYSEREYQVRMDIKKKTLYPKLVFALLLLVLPINIPLTLAGYLGGLSRVLMNAALLGGFGWFFIRAFSTNRSGVQLLDQIKLAVPVIGPLVRKMAAARFARSLAALYGAGVPIHVALSMAGETAGNHVLEQRSRVAVPALERGLPIARAIEATGFFPPMFIGMVSTGETTGNLDVMLDKAADFYEEESTHATTQLVVIMGVVVLIFVAILVAMKMLNFYAGLFNGIMNATGAAGGE